MTANWQSLLVGGFVFAALIYLLIKFFGELDENETTIATILLILFKNSVSGSA